jgi:hypothetical protein
MKEHVDNLEGLILRTHNLLRDIESKWCNPGIDYCARLDSVVKLLTDEQAPDKAKVLFTVIREREEVEKRMPFSDLIKNLNDIAKEWEKSKEALEEILKRETSRVFWNRIQKVCILCVGMVAVIGTVVVVIIATSGTAAVGGVAVVGSVAAAEGGGAAAVAVGGVAVAEGGVAATIGGLTVGAKCGIAAGVGVGVTAVAAGSIMGWPTGYDQRIIARLHDWEEDCAKSLKPIRLGSAGGDGYLDDLLKYCKGDLEKAFIALQCDVKSDVTFRPERIEECSRKLKDFRSCVRKGSAKIYDMIRSQST